jgi:hypothetical protein
MGMASCAYWLTQNLGCKAESSRDRGTLTVSLCRWSGVVRGAQAEGARSVLQGYSDTPSISSYSCAVAMRGLVLWQWSASAPVMI